MMCTNFNICIIMLLTLSWTLVSPFNLLPWRLSVCYCALHPRAMPLMPSWKTFRTPNRHMPNIKATRIVSFQAGTEKRLINTLSWQPLCPAHPQYLQWAERVGSRRETEGVPNKKRLQLQLQLEVALAARLQSFRLEFSAFRFMRCLYW